MRKLTKWIDMIHKVADNAWWFEGDGQGEYGATTKIPDQVLLENYLTYLLRQTSYVKELLNQKN